MSIKVILSKSSQFLTQCHPERSRGIYHNRAYKGWCERFLDSNTHRSKWHHLIQFCQDLWSLTILIRRKRILHPRGVII